MVKGIPGGTLLSLAITNFAGKSWLISHRDDVKYVKSIQGAKLYIATSRALQKQFTASGTLAVTCGEYILFKNKKAMTKANIAHELCHVKQARETVLFPLQYVWEYALNGYWNSRFEREARRAEKR